MNVFSEMWNFTAFDWKMFKTEQKNISKISLIIKVPLALKACPVLSFTEVIVH